MTRLTSRLFEMSSITRATGRRPRNGLTGSLVSLSMRATNFYIMNSPDFFFFFFHHHNHHHHYHLPLESPCSFQPVSSPSSPILTLFRLPISVLYRERYLYSFHLLFLLLLSLHNGLKSCITYIQLFLYYSVSLVPSDPVSSFPHHIFLRLFLIFTFLFRFS